MSNPKHTPGPWEIETYNGPMYAIKRDAIIDGEMPGHQTRANARLIACAPELLDALVNIVHAPTLDALKHAQRVIAKATGDGE